MAESETMSVDTSNEAQEDPLQDLPAERLLEMVEEITRSNQALDIETQMFENYLKRIEPKEAGKDGAMSTTQATTAQETLAPGGRLGARKRSKSRSGHADRMLRLTAEQKCDVAQREIEELKQEMSSFEDDSEKILDTYRVRMAAAQKAVMEEAEIRLAEIKKSSYEFDRDLVKGAVNTQTGKVVAERVERYFDDKHRARETLIEKLRLKNSTLKVQIKKLHMQLKQKEEMGEVLHEVDFNQLKIENSQYLEKIEERNSDLLRLKQMATNTVQVLNTFKKKLHILTLESDRLKSEISSRNELLTRIDAETSMVEEERQKAEHINRKYRAQLSDFRVPEVMEYVSEKAGLYELQKKVRSWERKVDIADMALKTHRKTWNSMKIGQLEV